MKTFKQYHKMIYGIPVGNQHYSAFELEKLWNYKEHQLDPMREILSGIYSGDIATIEEAQEKIEKVFCND